MNITTLEYFVSAVELSSFTKAAKKHFVAQTAVSQQMAKLEQNLGIKLFFRETNRVSLTDEGHIFYEDVKNILHEYELAVKKVNSFHQQQKKVITIGYKERTEFFLLMETIREFQQKYPEVEFVIKEETTDHLIEEVRKGICDLIVGISCSYSPEELKQLEHETIYQGEMVLGVSKLHEKAKRDMVTPEELAEEQFIVLNIGDSFRGFGEMHEHSKKDGIELSIADYAQNIGAQIMKVELNQGVSFFQDLIIDQYKDRICFLPIKDSAHRYDVDIVWNTNNQNVYLNKFLHFRQKNKPVC